VEVTGSIFYLGKRDSYIRVYDSKLTADDNKFFNATETMTDGKAIQCKRCFESRITRNIFTFLSGLKGGAIYLEASNSTTIATNTFTENKAEQGGALFVFYSDVQLSDNQFISNYAFSKGGSGYQHEGAGGAVFFTCANLADSNSVYREEPDFDYFGTPVNLTLYQNPKPRCRLDTGRNLFDMNEAEDRGGAIMYTNEKFTTWENNTFGNNTAPIGPDISSPVKSIVVEMLATGGSTERRRRLDD